ncbi:hypothetical protein GUITHDRAFT_154258 [Guillardia theta CCMP2712]|uniref:Uncharacterized protein n=1 Tax=Guillardia theta (strain CCMP2712) TaxID=905079 RepID=L1IUY4_GUITC|nr:hypothetical protein GUITHDRAFT_154258 [Guillardia theta CCMP2712]EKX39897.1 hypothetical protein GUITHDRAFT_154258 [Guillardia theta CCMP2712]|eukprot:XP_005826877.1 hypothetical protein GUITHDRAFT_154258 [Guillardia theta CCMP2712]
MWSLLVDASAGPPAPLKQTNEEAKKFPTVNDMIEGKKNPIRILDCGPMLENCNPSSDGGDYY